MFNRDIRASTKARTLAGVCVEREARRANMHT